MGQWGIKKTGLTRTINHSPPQESFEFQRTCSRGAKVRSQIWNEVFWIWSESLSLFCVKAAPPRGLGLTHSCPFRTHSKRALSRTKSPKNPFFRKKLRYIQMIASRDHSRYRFRVSCCFVFRFVNSCLGEHGGFLVLLGWLSPLVETWWRRDDDSGYSGKTRSIPFYIWIWTTYALWLPGSLIGYNAGFIQDYLVYSKPMGNLC